MQDLITISDIATQLKCSYHVARNRLNRTPGTDAHKQKLSHSVVYDKKVLELLCKN